MLSQKIFDETSAKVGEVLASSPAKDMEKNARTMMASAFSKLDLVTREEFDVQQEVLARTREKLEALEVRLAAVEALVLPPIAVAPEAVAEPVTETAPAAAPTPEAPGA